VGNNRGSSEARARAAGAGGSWQWLDWRGQQLLGEADFHILAIGLQGLEKRVRCSPMNPPQVGGDLGNADIEYIGIFIEAARWAAIFSSSS